MTTAPGDASGSGVTVAEACWVSHQRLLARLEGIDDVVVKRPSRLPNWTVGHVLTHLARNADSFVRMLEAAEVGFRVVQYPGGRVQRSGEIESGAARPAAAIVNDVRSTIARLDAAFDEAAGRGWEGVYLLDADSGATVPISRLPGRRRREVEVHHVDLGLGYEFADLPVDFVTSELGEALGRLPERIADPAQRAALLEWVAGRTRTFPEGIELGPF